MSKLYQKYQQLKTEDSQKCYLFKSGIFYIFLEDDARKLGPMLSLKITNLNDSIVKCGFPVNNLQKYLNIFKTLPVDIKVVETDKATPISNSQFTSLKCYEEFTSEICKLDINSLSVSEAFVFLEKIQKKATNILKENAHG